VHKFTVEVVQFPQAVVSPVFGAAVSNTELFTAIFVTWQVFGQLIPAGVLVTDPLPLMPTTR
jgi:hypothetical protein